jgi:hypothetical protein
MSMMNCQRCSHPIDTDTNVEACRYGFKMHGGGLIKTGNEHDVVTLCDNCFEGFGFEDDFFDSPIHSLAELHANENELLMERLLDEHYERDLDRIWEEEMQPPWNNPDEES